MEQFAKWCAAAYLIKNGGISKEAEDFLYRCKMEALEIELANSGVHESNIQPIIGYIGDLIDWPALFDRMIHSCE